MILVAPTRLHLKSNRYLPNFLWHTARVLTLMKISCFCFMQLFCRHKIRANSRLPLPDIFFCTTDFP
jgi:hypothetical protein